MTEDEASARIHALETAVEELKNLDRLAARRGSMRYTHRCPACGEGRLLHFRRLTHATGGLPAELALHVTYTWGRTKMYGAIEAFACRGCRLVQYYARDFEGVVPDGTNVVAIEPEPDVPPGGAPFR